MSCYSKKWIIGFILSLFILTACGGGGSSSDSAGDGDISLSGYINNGPLVGATVTVYDSDEFSMGTTKTEEDGFYTIDGLKDSSYYLVVAQGGTLNGQAYSGELTNRCTDSTCNLTPLTTVIEELSRKPGNRYIAVEQDMKDWLEIEEDPFMADFEGNPLENINLTVVRETIAQEGLGSWISQMISFYENNTAVEDMEEGWFGGSQSTENTPPTASITIPSDGSTYDESQSISFTGTGTDPEDGDLPSSSFAWVSSRDGQINSGNKSFSRSNLSAGTHTITLTVTDRDGATDSDSISVTVGASNQSPTASITSPTDGSTYDESQSISFTGTGTDPEDGDLPASAFEWESSIDGQINSGSKSFSRSNLSAGTQTITLTVTDSNGATDSDSISVTIGASNQSPKANITAPSDNSSYAYGDIVSFKGVSTDPEDSDLPASTFVWESSIDGLIETGSKEFSTNFLSEGSHTITLTVTDSDGATDSATLSVTIMRAMPDGDMTNSIGMTFNYIEPGTFMMGSPEDEPGRWSRETQHQVTLTQEYYMQTTEVTQGQWKAVMGSNPSSFSDCGDDCPVENVSWNDAQDFIDALNSMDQETYRLPTEAEWEYAARAGSTTAFANGQIMETGSGYDPVLDSIGWYTYNSDSSTHPVAQKDPNAWGLYDMHGNVYEWVSDWYGTYPSSAVTDPTGPASSTYRVVRGGSWSHGARLCRSAYRYSFSPGFRNRNYGFRLVLLPGH
ncbi:MAG: SUMF1/EgtB/PvdO family nonheme iron enzyme [Cyclonatronaceae bacterium]